MAQETVLITGASSGIGKALAERFAGDRADLVIVARRQERLESLAAELTKRYGVAVRPIALDLASPGAAQNLYDQLQGDGVQVDVVVNNAGIGFKGDFSDLSLAQHEAVMQLNMVALTQLARLWLPEMITRRRGGVLNVASNSAFQPGPGMAVYFASKAYVLSLTEALAEELRGSGVTATCLAPGMTITEFQGKAGMSQALIAKVPNRTPEWIAEVGHRAFRQGRVVVVPGLAEKTGAFMTRLAPRPILRRSVRQMLKL